MYKPIHTYVYLYHLRRPDQLYLKNLAGSICSAGGLNSTQNCFEAELHGVAILYYIILYYILYIWYRIQI